MQKFHRVVITLSLFFMAAVIASQWEKASSLSSLRPEFLKISLAAIVGIYFLDAYGWHLILKILGSQLPVSRSISIWLVSSLTRYVPGVIWSYASRVSLAKADGVSAATSGLSLYLETMLLMASALAVGLPSLIAASGLPISVEHAAILCASFGFLLHPKLLALIRYLPGKVGRAFHHVRLPSMGAMLALYLYYLVFWLLFGAAFLSFVLTLYPLPPDYWIPAGASIAMSFFAGFVLIFFPGGVGVRESALFLLLSPFLPTSTNLIVSVSSRLWVMFGEVMAIGFIQLIRPLKNFISKKRRHPPT